MEMACSNREREVLGERERDVGRERERGGIQLMTHIYRVVFGRIGGVGTLVSCLTSTEQLVHGVIYLLNIYPRD